MTLAPAWRRALPPLLILLTWVLFWYRDTFVAMVTIWARSDTFTHGFIVPPISLWLIWRQRAVLAEMAPRPCWAMALLLPLLGLGWLLGELAAINALTQFAATLSLIAVVVMICGWAVSRRIAFPLAFLLLAVPFGDFMMPTLMDWTAKFTVLGLRLTGIPVYQEGLQFVIPSGSWSVVQACSGVRYLIASLTVGVLFAYLNYHSLKRRLIFVAVSLAVPIVANWMRAYIIVMLGHVSGNKLATGVDHLIYGWLFFGVVIMLMFVIGARWAETDPPATMSTAPVSLTAKGGALWPATLLAALLAALPPLAETLIERSESTVPPMLLISPNEAAAGWTMQNDLPTDWRPAFQNPSAEMQAAWGKNGQIVGVYIGYYRHQNYERKLVSSENMLVRYQDRAWAQVASGHAEADFLMPAQSLRRAELRGAGVDASNDIHRLVAWQTYWVAGRLTTSEAVAKALTAVSRLFGQGDDGAVVVLYAPLTTGGEKALRDFARDNGALIAATLQHTREIR